ncbi:hypothetical protein [Roseomonas chloroacetimidivorans]|uniref:hypothetical protein n=1 Tax=Roseomonas chloroacetimidivorans TaxID=1766656 RepID=UPI003C707B39
MPPVRRPPFPGVQEDLFDLWLKRSLHERLDPVLNEDVPVELLRIACDSRSEREEMKRFWIASEERRRGSLL